MRPIDRFVRLLYKNPNLLRDLLLRLGVPCEGHMGPCNKVAETSTPALTAYSYQPEEGDMSPNRNIFLCASCSEAYLNEMKSRWDEYHAGLL